MTRRIFSERQRRILAWVAAGQCQRCGKKLDGNFHADHITPYARRGKTVTNNGQALCAPCNIEKGAR